MIIETIYAIIKLTLECEPAPDDWPAEDTEERSLEDVVKEMDAMFYPLQHGVRVSRADIVAASKDDPRNKP